MLDAPLRILLTNDAAWSWNAKQEIALKAVLWNNPVLKYVDVIIIIIIIIIILYCIYIPLLHACNSEKTSDHPDWRFKVGSRFMSSSRW